MSTLKSCVKKNGTAMLMKNGFEQWLVVGSAIYHMDGLPDMCAEELARVLDLEAEDASKCPIRQMAMTEYIRRIIEEGAKADKLAEVLPVRIGVGDASVDAVRPEGGGTEQLMLIDAGAMRVIDDEKPTLYMMQTEQGPCVVAKKGLMTDALVLQTSWAQMGANGLVALIEMGRKAADVLMKMKIQETERAQSGEQMRME